MPNESLVFIDGTIPKPTNTTVRLADWNTIHSMIVSWLLNTISPTLRAIVSYFEDAHEL